MTRRQLAGVRDRRRGGVVAALAASDPRVCGANVPRPRPRRGALRSSRRRLLAL